jgi:hypothetical protein
MTYCFPAHARSTHKLLADAVFTLQFKLLLRRQFSVGSYKLLLHLVSKFDSPNLLLCNCVSLDRNDQSGVAAVVVVVVVVVVAIVIVSNQRTACRSITRWHACVPFACLRADRDRHRFRSRHTKIQCLMYQLKDVRCLVDYLQEHQAKAFVAHVLPFDLQLAVDAQCLCFGHCFGQVVLMHQLAIADCVATSSTARKLEQKFHLLR